MPPKKGGNRKKRDDDEEEDRRRRQVRGAVGLEDILEQAPRSGEADSDYAPVQGHRPEITMDFTDVLVVKHVRENYTPTDMQQVLTARLPPGFLRSRVTGCWARLDPMLHEPALPAIQDRVQMMHTLTVDVGHLLFIHLTRHATAFRTAAQNTGVAAGLPVGDLNITGLALLNSDFATDEVHLTWAYKLCGRRNGFVRGPNAVDPTYLSLRRSYMIYLQPTMYPT
ncbi:hypothetical protein HKX48_005748 [Thoreauomyces humboldtii]|nr:hypothetical protein HKX48_005748 [Thoreauomyces humboldtii]